jgi:hypothetical protein
MLFKVDRSSGINLTVFFLTVSFHYYNEKGLQKTSKELSHVTGSWLTSCPDRYSYFHRIVPLLLTCIQDDVTEVEITQACQI